MVEGEKVGGDDGEVGVEGDSGEDYGCYCSLVTGDSGEGAWVPVREPVREEVWVGESGFEVEKVLRWVVESGKTWCWVEKEREEDQ